MRVTGKANQRTVRWGGKLLLVVLLLTFFEGAARKWVFPGSPALRYAAYFSKDVVFVLAAAAGARRAAESYRRAASTLVVGSGLLILLPSLLHMSDTNLIGAILSLRAYIAIPCCAFLASGTIGSVRDGERLLVVACLCILAVAALGYVQFNLPATHFLNRYDTGTEEAVVANAFGHVRATGTFAYIAGMGVLGAVAGWVGLYMLFARRGMVRLLGVAGMAGGSICALVSMSRGGLVWLALSVALGTSLFRRAKEAAIVIVLGLGAVWAIAGEPPSEGEDPGLTGSLRRRMEGGDNFSSRLEYNVMNLVWGLTESPLGEGLGRGQAGGNYAAYGQRGWGGGYESELGRIAFEVGVPGLIGVCLWRLAALYYLWQGTRTTEDRRFRALASASFGAFLTLSLGEMAFNHTGSSFAWLMIAVALGVLRSDSPRPVRTPRRRPTTGKGRRRNGECR